MMKQLYPYQDIYPVKFLKILIQFVLWLKFKINNLVNLIKRQNMGINNDIITTKVKR
jgi:hypothetical protein